MEYLNANWGGIVTVVAEAASNRVGTVLQSSERTRRYSKFCLLRPIVDIVENVRECSWYPSILSKSPIFR